MPAEPLSYDDFRTGYTFADVYHMLYNRKWKRRRGVLGYWRQLKLQMYAEYLRSLHEGGELVAAGADTRDLGDVPE